MATFHNYLGAQGRPATDLYVYTDGTVTDQALGSRKDRKATLAATLKANTSERVTQDLADALHKAGFEVDDTDSRSLEFERSFADPDRPVATGDFRVLGADEAAQADANRNGVVTFSNDEGIIATVPDPAFDARPEVAHPMDPGKVNPDPANPGTPTDTPVLPGEQALTEPPT